MPIVPIQLPPGLERNNTPYDSPGAWWDMNLMRWQSGSLVPVKGNTASTVSALTGAIRKLYPYRDNTNNLFVLVGTDTKLYVNASGYVDITPSGFSPQYSPGGSSGTTGGGYGTFEYGNYTYGDARPSPSSIYSNMNYWTFGNWGGDVILTANTDGRLFYYTSSTSSTAPTVISTAPTGNTSVLVTDERHVFVVGQQGGTGGNKRRVAWSSREDYTDWDYASTTNTAGFLDISSRSPLLKGVKVKEGVLIFSQTDIFLAQYVGAPYIYGFQRLSDTQMFHPDGIATFNGKAVWLTRSGFQIYSGGFVQSLECPLLNDILSELDASNGGSYIHASHNAVFSEIWFFYPTSGNTEANRYVIWNYQENWWTWGYMSRSAMAPAEIFQYPFMGDSAGNVYQHEVGFTDSGTSRVGQVWAETGALGLGNGDSTLHVKQVYPATGVGDAVLRLDFYSQYTPEGSESVFGPYTTRADGYTDVRVSGRDVRVRFTATQDADFGIGKMRFDVVEGGQR